MKLISFSDAEENYFTIPSWLISPSVVVNTVRLNEMIKDKKRKSAGNLEEKSYNRGLKI